MTKQKQIIKTVNAAFEKLEFLNQIDWTHYADELLRMTREEEKGHRGWGPDFAQHHTADTASIADAARMFAVKRVAEYLIKPDYPKGKHFLHMQKSCFYAAGLVDDYGEKIRQAWKGFDLAELAALDYCEIVHVRNDQEAA